MDKLEGIIHALHHLKVAFENAGLDQPSIQLNGLDDIWKLSTMSTDVLLKQRAGAETRINGILVIPAPVGKAEQWSAEQQAQLLGMGKGILWEPNHRRTQKEPSPPLKE